MCKRSHCRHLPSFIWPFSNGLFSKCLTFTREVFCSSDKRMTRTFQRRSVDERDQWRRISGRRESRVKWERIEEEEKHDGMMAWRTVMKRGWEGMRVKKIEEAEETAYTWSTSCASQSSEWTVQQENPWDSLSENRKGWKENVPTLILVSAGYGIDLFSIFVI